MYWLVGKHSELDPTNKRLLCVVIVKPMCTYGIQLREFDANWLDFLGWLICFQYTHSYTILFVVCSFFLRVLWLVFGSPPICAYDCGDILANIILLYIILYYKSYTLSIYHYVPQVWPTGTIEITQVIHRDMFTVAE